jgi:hypothetical protein
MPALLDFTTLANAKSFLGIKPSNMTEDARLNLFIPFVTSAIVEYLNWDPRSQIYTRYYSGNGLRELLLKQRMITAVSRVCIDSTGYYGEGPNAFPVSKDLIQGTDYAIQLDTTLPDNTPASRRGILERLNGQSWEILSRDSFFGGGFYGGFSYQYATNTGKLAREVSTRLYGGNILVVATCGYTTLPPDIEMAALLWISKLRRMASFGEMPASESLGEYSYQLNLQRTAGLVPPEGTVAQILGRYRDVII